MASTERDCGYYRPELEVMTARRREERLLGLVRAAAERACQSSPATRRLFQEAGLEPRDISHLGDLKRLPLTRKRDFPAIQRKEPPFGGFTTVSISELSRVFVSPGPIYDPEGTEPDFWNLRTAFYAGGFRGGDIVQNTFSYHLTPAGLMCDRALRDLGCVVVPTGTGNTEIQVTTMHDLKVTAYIGTPSYLMAILAKAGEMGIVPEEFSLELAYVAGEMLTSSMRRTLEGLGIRVRQGYITADLGAIGYECAEADGLHVPEDVVVEIVDPMTGEEKAPGEVGEVVVTTVKESYPLFRFATGDLSSLRNGGRCTCGRTAAKLTGIQGRADEVTKVRGMFIHPGMIGDILGRCESDMRGQAVVTRNGHVDVLVLRVVSNAEGDAWESLSRKITEAAREVLKLRATVERVGEGDLPPGSKRIEDRRVWQ